MDHRRYRLLTLPGSSLAPPKLTLGVAPDSSPLTIWRRPQPRRSPCGCEQCVLPCEVRARPLLLLVPAEGFAQAVLQRCELETELRADAIGANGDRWYVEVRAE